MAPRAASSHRARASMPAWLTRCASRLRDLQAFADAVVRDRGSADRGAAPRRLSPISTLREVADELDVRIAHGIVPDAPATAIRLLLADATRYERARTNLSRRAYHTLIEAAMVMLDGPDVLLD